MASLIKNVALVLYVLVWIGLGVSEVFALEMWFILRNKSSDVSGIFFWLMSLISLLGWLPGLCLATLEDRVIRWLPVTYLYLIGWFVLTCVIIYWAP